MEYFSVFVLLTLSSPCVLGYLVVMEGQCPTGQEPCCACTAGQEIPVLKKRIDSLEAQVAKLQETIERHLNHSDVHGRCPYGFIQNSGSCYYIGHNVQLSFTEAENFCLRHNNSNLIHLESAQENMFIVELLRNTSAGYCWTGLTDMDTEGVWVWYDTEEKPTFTYWFTSEPGGADVEDCAVYASHHSDYTWDDYPCSSLFHPICEHSANYERSVVG